MGIFKKLFGLEDQEKSAANQNWIALENKETLNSIVDESQRMPVLIYKHSTRCGISSMVWSGLQGSLDFEKSGGHHYYLDLLSYREISNEVATRFGIWHESPQAIVIYKGKVIHHSSHGQIDGARLTKIMSDTSL